MSGKVRGQIATLQAQIGSLERLADDEGVLDLRANAVSAWSVAEQVEHLLLTNRGIFGQIARLLDGEGEAAGKPTLRGRLLLTAGMIPRGRGRAPKFIEPTGRSAAELRALADDCRERLDGLAGRSDAIAASTSTAKHPYFGAFTPAIWLRFDDIHNRHHLAIVDDIREAS